MAELGLPGVKKGKTWVWRHLRNTRNTLVVLWRWFGAPSEMLAEDGGSAAQGSPALACSGPYGVPGLRNLAQKAREGWGVAHRGLGSKGGPAQRQRRRGPAAELDVVVVGRSMRAISGLLVPSVRRVVLLRRSYGVQGGRSTKGGGSGWNYGAAPVEVEQGGSGEFPGVEAELSRCLAGALVQRGGVAAVAQRSGAGRSWWRRLLGFRGGALLDGRGAGGVVGV